MQKNQKKQIRFSVVYIVFMLIGIWIFQSLIFRPFFMANQNVTYSQFRSDLAEGKITNVIIEPDIINYTTDEKKSTAFQQTTVYSVIPLDDPDLIEDLLNQNVEFSGKLPENNFFTQLLGWIVPLIPLAVIWYFLFKRMGQSPQSVMSIGKSNAKEIAGELTGVKFADVGGADEVEVELKEIIDFLKTPEKFTEMGARLPKGVLLVGPPGTGKTLVAKATAGEADVPFFSLSGSDFVQMFVGVGAARVRDLFEQAKAKAPCIVFIDEVDAIGQSRASIGRIGTNDEREQTLNQLLSEMDGFETNQGVVIMAATNRPEILDKALLRPGRFDRQVQVTLPTEDGRIQILKIHTKNVRLGEDVQLNRLAQITPGFSGADLANIVNEAALLAVRRESPAVNMADFDLAIERIVAGLQRKMPLKPEVRKKVAYHEAGHALVAQLLPGTDPVHKVSIIPTAKGALGYTLQMPEEDQYLIGEKELKNRMAVLLGGRVAELLIFNEPSTGASNDLERATLIAWRMVTEFGMTQSLGPVRYLADAGSSYLGIQNELRPELSPETATKIDQEIRKLVDEAQDLAGRLLNENMTSLHQIAKSLQEKEVISGKEIADIVKKN
jgi:cell division protease FtsH